MTEAKLPGAGFHKIVWVGTIGGRYRATCTCGWEIEGAKQTILNRAATHDMDMNNDPMSDCDGCGKPTVQDDLREVKGYGEKLFCPSCRDVPTDAEIEKSQRLLAAILGPKRHQ